MSTKIIYTCEVCDKVCAVDTDQNYCGNPAYYDTKIMGWKFGLCFDCATKLLDLVRKWFESEKNIIEIRKSVQ